MKKYFLIPLLASLLFSFIGCNFDIDFMLNDYNSNFQQPAKTAEGVTPQPGDDDFFPEDMLFDRYIVYSDGTLNLSGPSKNKCLSYTWTMFDPELPEEESQEIDVTLMFGFSNRTQRYVFYTPESGLEPGRTYQLQLRVEATNKRVYKDICEISVIKTYHTNATTRSIITNPSAVSYRNIMPTENFNVNNLTYWLDYKDTNNPEDTGTLSKITPYEMTLNPGEFNIHLDKGCYSMTLYAVNNSEFTAENIVSNAVLSARTVADMRYSSQLNFYLTSKDTTLDGAVKLKIFTDGWTIDSDTDVSINLTNSTNEIITATPNISLTKSNIGSNSSTDVNYSVDLNPGTYNLNVTFEKNGKQYVWTDKVIVTSGCNSEATIGIPNVISSGRYQFILYTDDWTLGAEDTLDKVEIKHKNGTQTISSLKEHTTLTKENLGNNADSTIVNLDIELETGKYELDLTYTYMGYEFTWVKYFSVVAGSIITDTATGIPKPDITGGASP